MIEHEIISILYFIIAFHTVMRISVFRGMPKEELTARLAFCFIFALCGINGYIAQAFYIPQFVHKVMMWIQIVSCIIFIRYDGIDIIVKGLRDARYFRD